MQQTETSSYRPVGCDLTDQLEAFSTSNRKIVINYRTWNDKLDIKYGHIRNLYTRDHADYLEMHDGSVIRLDQIIDLQELQ